MEQFFATFLLIFISLIILSFFFLFYKHVSLHNNPNFPPGKPGLPYLGESLEFLSTGWKGHPEKFIFDRIAKYSSNVFNTNLFGQPASVFCGAEGNKFLFSNENKLVVTKWPESTDKLFPFIQTSSSSAEEAAQFRKTVLQLLKPEALQQFVGIMDTIAQRHFASEWENKDEVVVFPLTKNFTLWLTCRVFLSLEDPVRIAEFVEPFNVLSRGIVSIPIDFPGTPFRRAKKASNFIRKEILDIIKERKVDLAEGKTSIDILSHMLITPDESGKYCDEMKIADKILALLVGGHETASSVCTSLVHYLSELPHIFQGVYNEQMEIAKTKGKGELLNWRDIQKMKYSWNVACEAMRLQAPIQGSFREAIDDFIFHGFSIPKGWKLYWSANSTHKSSEYFPEPEKFDPSRFEEKGPRPYTYVPFGGGPRMCPGKEYAKLQILVFMHNLVKRFRFQKIIPDEKIIFDPIAVPAKGLPLRLFPHKDSYI